MKHSGSRNGRDRGSFLLSYVGVRGRDREASTEGLTPDRLAGLVRGAHSISAASTMNADAQHAETEAAECARAATEAEAADESSDHELAVPVSAVTTDEGQSTAVVGDVGAADESSVVHLLALAQTLHDEYVSEGQNTRERLISEGQSRHDQVVSEASARQEELLKTGQATYDEFVSAGEAKHDALVAEAEALIADAQQKRAALLQELRSERSALQTEIEELRTFERDHRTRLKSYLKGQLNELAQTGDQETG